MIPSKRTHGMVLGAAAILAVAVPSIAHWVLSARIDDRLEPALAEALGTGVSIGSIEASLTGSVRVQDVRIDRVLEVDAIEASVGLGRLLRGDLRAEELRVVSPRVRVHVDAQGRSNLERLARRWAERKGGPGVARQARRDHGIRRIVVTEGDLVVHLGGHGEMRLRGVALQPRAGGVRMTVAGADLELGAGPYALRGGFDRMAGDLVLPAMRFDRLVAAGGDLTLHTRGAAPVRFQRAMLLRDGAGGGDRFAAAVERSGSSGRLVVTAPRGGRARLFEIQAQDVPLGPLGPLLPTGFELSAASGSGRAVVRRADGETELGVEASLARVAVDDARVARRRVETDLEVKTRVRQRGSELEILSFEARRGALDLALSGRLSVAAGVPERGTVELRLARTSCMEALGSLPEPLRDRLTGLRLAGTVAGRAEIDFTRADDRATRLEVDLDVADCKVLGDAVGADPRRLKAPFEHTFPDGSRGLIGYHDDDGNDGSYVTLRSLPDYIPAAWVAAEDARFFRHRGFDPQQIERSLGVNLREGELVRGGSTISQQLVKNVFLSRERNIARKLQEAVLTWRLEATVDKRLILERYLNLIELGPGVFGVARAARYWFDKDPQALTVAEAAFLVALTPAPSTMSRRVRERQALDPETASRVRIVLRHMRNGRAISEAQYERARRTNVQISARALARR